MRGRETTRTFLVWMTIDRSTINQHWKHRRHRFSLEYNVHSLIIRLDLGVFWASEWKYLDSWIYKPESEVIVFLAVVTVICRDFYRARVMRWRLMIFKQMVEPKEPIFPILNIILLDSDVIIDSGLDYVVYEHFLIVRLKFPLTAVR